MQLLNNLRQSKDGSKSWRGFQVGPKRLRPLLLFIVVVWLGAPDVRAQKMYWAGHYERIARADRDGSRVELLREPDLFSPYSIQIDIDAGALYFLDDNKVKRVGSDGRNLAIVIDGLSNPAYTLALDPTSGDIYWTDHDGIRRLNSSATQIENLVVGHTWRYGLALDPQRHLMYWSDHSWGAQPGYIYCATMDGDNPHVIITLPSGRPQQIAIDPGGQKIYWVDKSVRRVFRANVDGTNVEQIVNTGSEDLDQLALDPVEGKLYWTTEIQTAKLVMRANLDGSNAVTIFADYSMIPSGIAVDSTTQLAYLAVAGPTYASIQRITPDNSEWTIILENLLANPQEVAIDAASGHLYWADRGGVTRAIRRMRLDGTEGENFITVDATPHSLALRHADNAIYWTEYGRLSRASLSTRQPEVLLESALFGPRGIAFDALGEKLYWVDLVDGAVRRMRIDGTDLELIIPNAGYTPWGIAVDGVRGRLFWTDYYDQVRSANLDGSDAVVIFDDIRDAFGIAIDPALAKIYFVNENAIRRSSYDGSNLETVVEGELVCPAGVAFDGINGRVYWVNDCDRTIQRVDIDGANVETVLAGFLTSPREVALDLVNNKLYITDMIAVFEPDLGGRIVRADLDGSNAEVIVEIDGDPPRGILVDAANERIIWTESSDYDGLASIKMAALDGSNKAELLVELVNGDLDIDEATSKLYLAQSRRIRRASLDGLHLEDVVMLTGTGASGVEVDSPGGKIYWGDWNSGEIFRANSDGTNVELVASNGPPLCSPSSIEIDEARQYLYWACANGSSIRRISLASGANVEVLLSGDGVIFASGLALNGVRHIVSSLPPPCATDARQPHDINDPMLRYGWSDIELEFSGTLELNELLDFEVLEAGGDGVPPNIESVSFMGEDLLRITLDDVIESGAWTCIHHINSGTKSCLGYLPGDVNGDGTSSPIDILHLIDSLNGVIDPPYDDWQIDIDRSGSAGPGDILRLIDLLNGAKEFEVWNGRSLGVCP